MRLSGEMPPGRQRETRRCRLRGFPPFDAGANLRRPDWNRRYLRGEHVDDPPLPLFVTTVAGLSPGRALDLACGPGRHALHLAERGWDVTAVDSSRVAVDLLRSRAAAAAVALDARVADLERGGFAIEEEAYDLICDVFYLQRDLFPKIRSGLRPGGLFFGVVHLVDENAPPMNPAFLLDRGELPGLFGGWEVLHYAESAPQRGHRRCAAELVCRKPR
jgi:SAM-dependent methyltransferase